MEGLELHSLEYFIQQIKQYQPDQFPIRSYYTEEYMQQQKNLQHQPLQQLQSGSENHSKLQHVQLNLQQKVSLLESPWQHQLLQPTEYWHQLLQIQTQIQQAAQNAETVLKHKLLEQQAYLQPKRSQLLHLKKQHQQQQHHEQFVQNWTNFSSKENLQFAKRLKLQQKWHQPKLQQSQWQEERSKTSAVTVSQPFAESNKQFYQSDQQWRHHIQSTQQARAYPRPNVFRQKASFQRSKGHYYQPYPKPPNCRQTYRQATLNSNDHIIRKNGRKSRFNKM